MNNAILPGNRVYCGSLRDEHIGQTVEVCGWVSKSRDLGGLSFTDVRDRTGIVQCVVDETATAELQAAAARLRAEFAVRFKGTVRQRSSINDKISTGRIEILATELEVFSAAEVPPFEIKDDTNVGAPLRLKYRYLDLRRPSLQRIFALRHRIMQVTRRYYDAQGFLEIETPILTKSTPEGARDYLVPSRVHPGEFYALPQSPQQYKQLLMLAGFDRYIQIARCFRDEDLRFDRQPEFTQVDLEMSFSTMEDIMAVHEGYAATLLREVVGAEIPLPLPRITYAEAMARYGSDKPDTRFGLELCDVSETVRGSGFGVFDGALEAGGAVLAITVPGGGKLTRKEIDALGEYVKTYRAKGLAWYKIAEDGTASSSFAKFLGEEMLSALLGRTAVAAGDLLLIVADGDLELAQNALGSLRVEVARRMNLIPEGQWNFLWVTEFPMFEYGEDDWGNTRLYAKHHPFTCPMDEDLPLLKTAPDKMRAKAYDLVLNGSELGGGSIRIHRSDVQAEVFGALGFTKEAAEEQFGHLINAFKYGAPPHGGIAFGLDRIVMHLAGTDSIQDVVAFPKTQQASDLMMDCPSPVDPKQLEILGVQIAPSAPKA